MPEGLSELGLGAFQFCSSLRDITIPAGLTELENLIFSGCSALTEITIPLGIEKIGNSIFTNTDLSAVTVEEGNPVYQSEGNCIIRKSDNEVVAGCKASVLPSYVKRIGPYAFLGCSFTSIVIPEGVEKIGSNAFAASQLAEITMPNTLTTIETGAFYGCTKLTQIAIPESVKEIGSNAFYKCPFLIVLLPGSVETIGSAAFTFAYIYTSATPNYPAGWYRSNPAPGAPDISDPSWVYTCVIAYNCTFGYDDGRPYMDSCVWTFELEDGIGGNTILWNTSLPTSPAMRTPVREGYTFMGWTTEKGSDKIAFNPETAVLTAVFDGGASRYSLKTEVCYFSYKELEALPIGTVVYARWVPDK